jgi:transcriptional regulator with XRE-family HTH domain
MKVKTKFGERIRKLREEAGINQPQFAQILNVKTATINRYENDVREPEYATLIQIADYFNVSTDYLLGRTENRKRL